MASLFKKLFGTKKGANAFGIENVPNYSSLSKKDKLIAERDQLIRELKRTKVVSTRQREDMMDRIEEINKILRREFNISSSNH